MSTNNITVTSVDDNSRHGDGTTTWFSVRGETFGLAVQDGGEPRLLDCDGTPLDIPSEHVSAQDLRTMVHMLEK